MPVEMDGIENTPRKTKDNLVEPGKVYPLKQGNRVSQIKRREVPEHLRAAKDNIGPSKPDSGIDLISKDPIVKKPKKKVKRSSSDSSHKPLRVFLAILSIISCFYIYHIISTSTPSITTPAKYENEPKFDFFNRQNQTKPLFSTDDPIDDKVFENVIREQFEIVNREINNIINAEFTRVHSETSTLVNENLLDIKRRIKSLENQKEPASKEQLENVQHQVDRLASVIELIQNHESDIKRDIGELKVGLSETILFIETLRTQLENQKKLEAALKQFEVKVDALSKSGKLNEKDISELKVNTKSFMESMQRLEVLEQKLESIENNYVTKSMDVNLLIEEYLTSHGIANLNEESVKELIANYVKSHPIVLDDMEPEEVNKLLNLVGSHVEKEMHRLVYEDDIGKPDFALAAVGAKIIDYSGKYSINNILDKLLPFSEEIHPPSIVLRKYHEVGDCWAFYGSNAYLSIALSSPIHPDSISIDHISSSIAHTPDLSSAPKDFRVYGFTEAGSQGILLGDFTYDRDGNEVQNFIVNQDARNKMISIVKVEFLSNYGSGFTCIYRFRVHGTPVNIRRG